MKTSKPKEKRWKPKEREEYWYIGSDSLVWSGDFYSHEIVFDRDHYRYGNCFKTEAEAELYAEKIRDLLLSRFN